MPTYKVIAPGFYESKFYHPEGKRPVLTTDNPFTKKNPMPSWLSDMPEESASLKAKRVAYEKEEAKQAKQNAEDIASASTEGEGEKPSFINKLSNAVSGKSSNVETI